MVKYAGDAIISLFPVKRPMSPYFKQCPFLTLQESVRSAAQCAQVLTSDPTLSEYSIGKDQNGEDQKLRIHIAIGAGDMHMMCLVSLDERSLEVL